MTNKLKEAEAVFTKMAQLRESYVKKLQEKWGNEIEPKTNLPMWQAKYSQLSATIAIAIDDCIPNMTPHETAVLFAQLIGQPMGAAMLNEANDKVLAFAQENAEYYGQAVFDFIQAARAAITEKQAGSPEAAKVAAEARDAGPKIIIPKGLIQ